MTYPSVDRIVQKAAMLEPEAYLEWCDTISGLGEGRNNIFHVPAATYGEYTVVQMDGFYWPDGPAFCGNGHVRAFKEPGAYIESYFIFAVNRNTQVAWALYVGMARDEPGPMLEPDTAVAVCKAFNGVWHAKKREQVTEQNKAVDRYLDKARELSPEAYVDWCDAQKEECFEAYNDNYAGDVSWDDERVTIAGVRFTTRWKDTCDIFAVSRKLKRVYGVRYHEILSPRPKKVPDEPMLTGATADAVLAAVHALQKEYNEEKKSVTATGEQPRRA